VIIFGHEQKSGASGELCVRSMVAQCPDNGGKGVLARGDGALVAFIAPMARIAALGTAPNGSSVQEQLVSFVGADVEADSCRVG